MKKIDAEIKIYLRFSRQWQKDIIEIHKQKSSNFTYKTDLNELGLSLDNKRV
jgi:hypothetical protein